MARRQSGDLVLSDTYWCRGTESLQFLYCSLSTVEVEYIFLHKYFQHDKNNIFGRLIGQDATGAGDLFTGALFHAYSPPPGFCFDSLCTDVIMDDATLEDYNFDKKVMASEVFSRMILNFACR